MPTKPDKKKPGKKGARKGEPKNRPTDAQKEEWFQYWIKADKDKSKTAKHFGVQRMTVVYASKQRNWDERAKAIDKQIQKRIDSRLAKEEVGTIKIVQGLKNKTAKILLAAQDLGITVGDFIKLCKYEDELIGNAPGDAGGDNIVNIQQYDTSELATVLRNTLELLALSVGGSETTNSRL